MIHLNKNGGRDEVANHKWKWKVRIKGKTETENRKQAISSQQKFISVKFLK